MKMTFDYDSLIEIIEYNDVNGKKLDIGTFSKGNGFLNVYDETGNLINTVEFSNGRLKR